MKCRIWLVPLLVSLFAAVSVVRADAVSIVILESGDGPPNFSISPACPAPPAAPCILTQEPEILVIDLRTLGIEITPAQAASIILLEPEGDFNPPFSDIVTLFPGTESAPSRLVFESDTTGPVMPYPGIPVIAFLPETGELQDLDFHIPGLTVAVQSDLTTPEVPEPTSILLVGTGLVGVTTTLRRRRRGPRR